MCLSLVMKVEKIYNKEALCDYLGVKRKIRIDVINNVKVGDYLLVHAGFALNKLSREEAEERITLFNEIEAKLNE